MTETLQQKCLKAYYKTDIEPTLDRLLQVKDIVSNFELEGADRLLSALKMKHMDLVEIERLAEYIYIRLVRKWIRNSCDFINTKRFLIVISPPTTIFITIP